MQEEKKEDRQIHPDRFTSLMFGSRKKSEISPKEEYDWILGKRKPETNHENNLEQSNSPLEKLLQNIDYVETMKHVDTLMSSANELKPILKKVKPLIETFLPKK